MAKIQISISILFTLISCWTQGQQINTVEVGATRYYISDFSPYSPRYNWFLAFQYCNTIGMELLTMPRQEETIELLQFLQETGKSYSDYWTSGNQLGSPMWTWMSNGQQLNSTFSYWDANGPPLTKGANSCMNLQSSKWSASDCMAEKSFICQLTRCYYFNYVVTSRQGNRPPSLISQLTKKSTLNDERDQDNSSSSSSSSSNSVGNIPNSNPESSDVAHLKTLSSASENTNDQSNQPTASASSSNLRPVRSHFNSHINSQENRILDDNNDVESIGALSQELTPPQVTSGDEVYHIPSPIVGPPINADTIAQKLRRKETFSWAFTDDSHNNPK